MNAHRYTSRNYTIVAVAALAVLLALAVAAVRPAVAYAADSSSSASSSAAASSGASSASAESTRDLPSADPLGGLPMMGDDYVWFGNELKMKNARVDNDLIVAGRDINIVECSTLGDMRLAGEDITIKDSTASENITAAGQKVAVQNSDAKAVVLAGQKASFSGTCKDLSIYAETVFIDGTVEGDVVVGANSVEVGSNARILGTLHVESSSEPVMQRGSEVGDVKYTHVESTTRADMESAFTALSLSFSIFFAIIGLFGTFITAILAEWLFRRQTAGAAEMMRNRTGATIGTGVVAAIVAPVVVILMMCLGVTFTAAMGLMFALFAITAVAGGFMGASLFKLAFPKLGRFKCAMAGGAIVGVASAIPVLGAIVDVAAFMYLLGYVLQCIFLGMRDPEPTAPAAQAAPGAPVMPPMTSMPPAGNVPPMNAQPMAGAPVVQQPQQAPYAQTPPPNNTF